MDRETIIALTIAVRVYRKLRAMGVYDMPIKWNVAGKAMKARGIMDQISAEYDGFIEQGGEHLADVKGLRGQVGDMQDDLSAAANVMGNGSGNGSGESKEPPAEKQVISSTDVGKIDQDPVSGSPAVGQTSTTFQQQAAEQGKL